MKIGVVIIFLSLTFFLEFLFPLFQARSKRMRHALINLTFGGFNAFLVGFLFSSLTVFISQWSELNHFGLLHWMNASPLFSGCIAFILFDVWMYVWHRINHRVPFFWAFHRMHHTDLSVDSTTAFRFHTGEIVLSSLMRLAVIPLIGINLNVLMLYEICLQPIIILHHSNLKIPENWDRAFRFLIVTPNMHRVHHSQIREETNSNYASIFSLWDRLGKTFQKRSEFKTLVFGLPEFTLKSSQSFFGMVKTPFFS